jgi:hypothetical protein
VEFDAKFKFVEMVFKQCPLEKLFTNNIEKGVNGKA